MDIKKEKLIVGMANRLIYIYDLRKPSEPLQKRESSLKYQTRCIRWFIDGQGFVCSSIEGRVAVDYLDPAPEVQAQKFAFKCHRQPLENPTTEKTEIVYPVNALAFHPMLLFTYL